MDAPVLTRGDLALPGRQLRVNTCALRPGFALLGRGRGAFAFVDAHAGGRGLPYRTSTVRAVARATAGGDNAGQ